MRKVLNFKKETVMNSSFFHPPDGNAPVSAFCAQICLSIIVLVVSLPLNIYVLRLILIGVRNLVASEFFALNLCVCEIIICLNVVFGLFIVTNYQNEQNMAFLLVTLFLSLMHSISLPFFQCCVCVERYMAVIHPIFFLKYKPLRYRTAISTFVWIIVLGLSVVSLFLQLRNILYYILLPEYMFVCSIKILCSIAVLKALRKSGPGGKLSVKDAESNNMKKKAFLVIVIILVCMLITYCPMMMLVFVYDSLSDTQKITCISALSYFMIFAGFVHPFLYLHRAGKLPFIPSL